MQISAPLASLNSLIKTVISFENIFLLGRENYVFGKLTQIIFNLQSNYFFSTNNNI